MNLIKKKSLDLFYVKILAKNISAQKCPSTIENYIHCGFCSLMYTVSNKYVKKVLCSKSQGEGKDDIYTVHSRVSKNRSCNARIH